MINIEFNGETVQLHSETPLTEFLEKHAKSDSFALAINQCFLPRGNYTDTTIRDGDKIELLTPMQGG